MFCCMLLYVNSSIAIILMGKRELVALLNLSSWCLVMVERLFLAVPAGCLRFVIVVFPDHTHLLFLALYYLFAHNTKTLKNILIIPYRDVNQMNRCTTEDEQLLFLLSQLSSFAQLLALNPYE